MSATLANVRIIADDPLASFPGSHFIRLHKGKAEPNKAGGGGAGNEANDP